jgi:alanyl-tRNA synthetase
VALTEDLVKKGLKAGDIIRPVAEIVGGKGGGKPELAQAGGKDPAKLGEALAKAMALGKELLAK